MKTLIQSARIISPGSPHHGKKRDVLIDDGKIIAIGADLDAGRARVTSGKDLYITAGWIDMKANFCDPGLEYKEDLQSGLRAAERGGFAQVVLMPSTHPVADNKGSIEYTLTRSESNTVNVLPCGTLSERMEGKQLSEMFDMHNSGAVAFTDDKHNVGTELMTRALEYAGNFGGLVMSFPYDKGVNEHGQIHEGPTSVSLGLKGIPAVAEELRLQRDIELMRYTGGRLHVTLISTARSVELIRKAKKEKLRITCGIAAHQLSFTDEDMASFDSNLKVMPPFRSRDDRKALIAGLKDGTIDVICSDHQPEDVEHKVREFEDADYGISSIETTFCAAWTALAQHMEVEDIIAKFTISPARILGLDIPVIEEGCESRFTVFSASEKTSFTKENWLSKSKNSPYIGMTLDGNVKGVF